MKNLILSSIILILFSGCSSTMMKGFHHIPENMIDTAAVKPWFQGQSDHFLFQTNINIYKNHFGGIMVVKSLSLESHRVVYVTELGIKIFDMEFFKNGDFKLHYCMDEINKKYVIKTLKNDLGLLLVSTPTGKKSDIWQDSQRQKTIVRSKDNIGLKSYIIDEKTKKVEEILVTKNLHKKMKVLFFSANGTELDSVRIKHYKIKLNIQLSKLNDTR